MEQICGKTTYRFCTISHINADTQLFGQNSTNIILQAPYLPDLVFCDIFLFFKLKLLCETFFESREAVKENSLKELKVIPSLTYEKCFEE